MIHCFGAINRVKWYPKTFFHLLDTSAISLITIADSFINHIDTHERQLTPSVILFIYSFIYFNIFFIKTELHHFPPPFPSSTPPRYPLFNPQMSPDSHLFLWLLHTYVLCMCMHKYLHRSVHSVLSFVCMRIQTWPYTSQLLHVRFRKHLGGGEDSKSQETRSLLWNILS